MEKQDIYESLIGLLFPSDITEHFKMDHLQKYVFRYKILTL